ncbi:MAG: LPXTG cell wall anchor domain-containing protein [Aeromicrobium sp.]
MLAVFVAAIGLSMTAVPAQAEGYGTTVVVTISDIIVVGGNTICVDAQAKTSAGAAVEGTFEVTFSGDSAPYVIGPNPDHAAGSSFHHCYATRVVPERKNGTAIARFTYEDSTVPAALGGVGRLSMAFPSALQTVSSRPGIVDLLPLSNNHSDSDSDSDGHGHHHKHHKHHGGLPDTGGERLLWLIIGLVLVGGGATVVVSSRKRDSAA